MDRICTLLSQGNPSFFMCVAIWVLVISSHGYMIIWVDTNATHLINCVEPLILDVWRFGFVSCRVMYGSI
jgi:hypothetical protein